MEKFKQLTQWQKIGVIAAILVILGGGTYFHLSHMAPKRVPGQAYVYHSVAKKKQLYVAFSRNTNKAVVDTDQKVVKKAMQNEANFNAAYQAQVDNGDTWQYKVEGSKLTLAETKDDNVSQWQYNGVLATKNHLYTHGFSYQISQAGQGKVNNWTKFTRLDD